AAFPLGSALAVATMQESALARVVPIGVGAVVLLAGALQFTAWKARYLAGCRNAPGCGHALPADAGTAWRHGLRLGLHCSHCCAGLMAILLVIGVMDLRAMAVVAAAINVERRVRLNKRTKTAIDRDDREIVRFLCRFSAKPCVDIETIFQRRSPRRPL